MPPFSLKAFRRACRSFLLATPQRRASNTEPTSPHLSQHWADCLLHRGFLESYLILRSSVVDACSELDPEAFYEFLIRDGELAVNPPRNQTLPAGIPHSILFVGGCTSNASASLLSSTSFLHMLSAPQVHLLDAALENISQLVVLDEKAASLLLINREAVSIVNRQIHHSITLYGNFLRQQTPVFCRASKRVYFSLPWLATNGFVHFPNRELHCPRLGAGGWVTGQFDASEAIDHNLLLDRWAGFMTWSRYRS